MKVGDKVKVIRLVDTDRKNTDLKDGDTGVVVRCTNDSRVVHVKLDRDILHRSFNWHTENGSYEFYTDQLEVIKTEPTKTEPTITITKDEFMDAVAHTMASGKTDELIKRQPIMALAFSTFGALLTEKLFGEEREDK